MARGGGGGGRSSGSHSSSRSSGGHRSSSSGRSHSSSSRSYSSHRSSSYGGSHYHHHSYGHSYDSGGSGSSTFSKVFVIAFVIIWCLIFFAPMFSSMSSVSSSYAREKLNLGYTYDYDCVEDNAYWLDSPTHLATSLKHFYDKTGVQPYILIEKYKPELTTDDAKLAYAEEFYEDNFPNENVFLYVYFEDSYDTGEGYQCYVNGLKIDSMMDSEAVDIFWNYIDSYWYSDMSSDDLFEKAFNKTADKITTKSKTPLDILWVLGIIVVCIIIPLAIIMVIRSKRKAEAEKAAETERILSAPLGGIQSISSDLVDKYTK